MARTAIDETSPETPVDDAAAAAATTAADEEAQAQADFDEGASEGTVKPAPQEGERQRDEAGRFAAADDKPAKPVVKEEKPVAAAPAKSAAAAPPAKPEYVQITKDQLTKFEAALGRTEEFEKQFSKVFGTVGDMQKILRGLQAQTPRGAAVKLPPGAFDKMKKDFPELAELMKTEMEEILKGTEGTGTAAADPEEFERKLEARVLKLAAEDLADEFPDWQKIVGAVAKDVTPDPNNLFRKWLGTKPQEYQDRVNSSNSAGVITRAIRTFKSETKAAAAAPAKPNGQAQTRANRIQEAVRPKGDGGHPPGATADDEFESGFKTG